MSSCSHPRSDGDMGAPVCRVCNRVRRIVLKVERDQRRINTGRFYTLGQRIARGIA